MLISLIGIFYFNEPLSFPKVIFTMMIVIGVVGLYLTGGEHQ